jgi:hypothetical protein
MGARKFDGVHMIDIYQCGDDPHRALDPSFIRSVTEYSAEGCVRVVLRAFFGEAGCDDVTPGPAEGVWYRDTRGLVVFYPEGSRVSAPYAPHPDANWLVEGRSRDGLALAVERTYGPYSCIKAAAEHPDAIKLIEAQPHPRGDFQKYTPKITCPQEFIASAPLLQKVLERADRALPENVRLAIKSCTPVIGHSPTVKVLAGSNQLVLNGFSMRGLRDKVSREFERDPKMRILRETLPSGVYTNLVEGTILAVTFADRKDFVEKLLSSRMADSKAQAMFVKAYSAEPGSTVYITAKKVLCGVAGVTFVAVTGSWLYLFAHGAVAHGLHFTMLASGKYAAKRHTLKATAVAAVVGTGFVWTRAQRALRQKFSSSRAHYDEYCEVLASGGESAPCVKSYVERLVDSQPFCVPLLVDDTLPCAAVPRDNIAKPHGQLEVEFERKAITYEDAVNLVDCTPKGAFYPLIGTASGLAPPSNISGVALNAMCARALPDLPVVDYSAVEAHVSVVVNTIKPHLKPLEADRMLTLEECASLMPARPADRFRRTVEEISNGRIDEYMYTKKKTMLKANEIVKVGPAIKARLLDCLEPAHTVATMQAARGALTAFKDSFSVDDGFLDVGDWTLHIICCSGASPASMDAVGEVLCHASLPTILCAGDDCTIYWGPWQGVAGVAATEVDGEKFDITQCIELLAGTSELFKALLVHCPVDAKVFDYFTTVATKPLRWSDRKQFKITAKPRSRAPTGTPFTTVMNNCATVMWVVHHFSRVTRATCTRDELLDVATSGAQLGFKLTVEHHSDITQAVFLKSVFLPGPDGRFKLCMLPSQILKLGKSITRPTISQRVRDPRLALSMVAGAMGRSMPSVRDDLPIVGPFLAVMRRHGDKEEAGEVEELNDNPYKVVGSNQVDRATYMEFVCERYGTTKAEIEELEDMIIGINRLPVLIGHPLVSRMSLRDYY